jgi:Flp pilus assembly protein TadG
MIGRLMTLVRTRFADAERGSVVLWVAITTPALLLMVLLIVDGGAKMKAGEQASTYSSEAARAATMAVGPRSAGTGTGAAVDAANAYLASAGVTGTVTMTGPAAVTVTVSITRTGPISGVRFELTRSATAQLRVGLETGQAP